MSDVVMPRLRRSGRPARAGRPAPPGRRRTRRAALVLVLFGLLLAVPTGASAAGPCDLAPDLAPQRAGSGIDSLVEPVRDPAGGPGAGSGQRRPDPPDTLYERYGTAGTFWHTRELGCPDVMAVMGNSMANTVFSLAKSTDRATISVYQSAMSDSLLDSIKNSVIRVIASIKQYLYDPFVTAVVLLGAMWLAWWGLLRKRASVTLEGALWMVVAGALGAVLLLRPDWVVDRSAWFTNMATGAVNSAFSNVQGAAVDPCLVDPPGERGAGGRPDPELGSVDRNADALWSTLVCRPWLAGAFGSSSSTDPLVQAHGKKLLDAQTVTADERSPGQGAQEEYDRIGAAIKSDNPEAYAIFQGKDWTARLMTAIVALMAALFTGLLILILAVSLIILKIGFLVLLVAGPVFLLIGIHPGFGRVVLTRWIELLISTLLRQVALVLLISLLLFLFTQVMATTLPWFLQTMLMGLLTLAAFFYRKPFQHLFTSVGYSAIGQHERASMTLSQSGSLLRRATLNTATVAVPGVAGARMARWVKQNPAEAASIAAGVAATAGAVGAGAAGGRVAGARAAAMAGQATSAGAATANDPAAGSPDGAPEGAGAANGTRGGARVAGRGGRRQPPPLNLPPRTGGRPVPWPRTDAPGEAVRAGAGAGAAYAGSAAAARASAATGAAAGAATGAPAGRAAGPRWAARGTAPPSFGGGPRGGAVPVSRPAVSPAGNPATGGSGGSVGAGSRMGSPGMAGGWFGGGSRRPAGGGARVGGAGAGGAGVGGAAAGRPGAGSGAGVCRAGAGGGSGAGASGFGAGGLGRGGSGGSGSGGGRSWWGSGGGGTGGSGSGGGGTGGGGGSGGGGGGSNGGRRSAPGWFGSSSGSRRSADQAPPVRSSSSSRDSGRTRRSTGDSRSGPDSRPVRDHGPDAGGRSGGAPPLWARPRGSGAPDLPFWLRPADRDD